MQLHLLSHHLLLAGRLYQCTAGYIYIHVYIAGMQVFDHIMLLVAPLCTELAVVLQCQQREPASEREETDALMCIHRVYVLLQQVMHLVVQ
jgi:hypothetical protein